MWQLIQKLLWWLFPKKPSPLKSLTLEVYDMSNARLAFTLPTPTIFQRPLAAVRIDARVSVDLPWTEIALVDVSVATPPTDVLIEDVAPGTWFYQGIVVDAAGRTSPPLSATLDVDFDDPSPLVAFTATLV